MTVEVLTAHYSSAPLYVSANGETGEVTGAVVSSSYFALLGLQPRLGRFFTNGEDSVPDRDAVAVLGYGFWQRRFGGEDSVLGKTVRINNSLMTVIGVTPRFLAEVADDHPGVEVRVVDTLANRKLLMAELAAGFIALPGGLGTLDELAEMATWTQLGVHDKPVVLLDLLGYWSKLAELLDSMVDNGFLRPEGRALLRFESDPAAALDALS